PTCLLEDGIRGHWFWCSNRAHLHKFRRQRSCASRSRYLQTPSIWTRPLCFRTSCLVRRTNRKKRMTKRLRSSGTPQSFHSALRLPLLPLREPSQFPEESRKQEIC